LLDCEVDGRVITHRLLDVLFAPACAHNLVSISRLDDAGIEAEFKDGRVQFIRRSDGKVLAAGRKTGRLYPLAARSQSEKRTEAREGAHAAIDASERTWDAWH
ncbi:hypothetical protein C8F01DRAFT_926814, partial [Mycena amicta]